mgnify:CR=1 FL=1
MSGRQSEVAKVEAAKRAERIAKAEQRDVTELMDSPAFRRYAKRYLNTCSVFKTTFTGTSETFFREGQRAIGTTILAEIMSACPERFAELMAERLASDEPKSESDED